MYNKTRNPDNKNYNVFVDGTTNMTSTLKAPAFCAKGHYYQLSPEVESSKCKILDMNDKPITTDKEADDTYLGMEKFSGACVIAKERIFYNFQIWNDQLF